MLLSATTLSQPDQHPARPAGSFRFCAQPGCSQRVKSGRCEQHSKRDHRPDASQRGYDHAWRKLATKYREAHPFCAHCQQRGRIEMATEVDHILPVSERPDLRLVWSNLQSLCHPCHVVKTYEDGKR